MNQSLFKQWFETHFLRYIPTSRPVLLLMDGHSSHYCPEMVRMAVKQKIILCTLPPHTTHLTRPLDKGCFAPLKVAWCQACQKFCADNPGRVVTIYDFSAILSEAWGMSMSAKNITSGFKVTGVYPVDRYAVQLPGRNPVFKSTSLAEKSGLAYIPLYSPAPTQYRTRTTMIDKNTTLESYSQSHLYPDISLESPESSFLWRSHSPDDERVDYSSGELLLSWPTHSSGISKFLNTPADPAKQPTKHVKSCGQVLTSSEIMKKMEEAEKLKADKVKEKQERELKRIEKARGKARI